jgi:hypothetical protein
MKVSEAFPSKYLRAADLQGKNVSVVILSAEYEQIGDDNKIVIYFQGKEKGLVLNKTNANNIATVYGDDTDDWTGGDLILFPAMVDFQGRTVEAVRVRVPPRKAAAKSPAAPPPAHGNGEPPAHMDDEIPF